MKTRDLNLECSHELCSHLLEIIEKQGELITKLVNENFRTERHN